MIQSATSTLDLNQQVGLLNIELSKAQQKIDEQQKQIEQLEESQRAVADANIRIAELYEQLEEAYDKLAKSEAIEAMNKELATLNEELNSTNEELTTAMETVKTQNAIIENKRNNILASINYAKRIQDAVLPHNEAICKTLPENFIFFRPKDIVSGDFYWFTELNRKNNSWVGGFEEDEGKIVFIAADCTGHGVPGAIMSMIGSNALHEIIHLHSVTSPDEILYQLQQRITSILKQEINDTNDGMDVTVCVIDRYSNTVEFAGARNGICYIQEGSDKNEVTYIRGDKVSIGERLKDDLTFTKHIIPLTSKTTLYMYSDGYEDQFGGVNNKKFLSKNLKQLFYDIHPLPLYEQKQIVGATLEEWMGGVHPQTDDIMIIGIRI
jgi:serine phosphatase RsbU (regulator of sigma subunit)